MKGIPAELKTCMGIDSQAHIEHRDAEGSLFSLDDPDRACRIGTAVAKAAAKMGQGEARQAVATNA